MAWSSVIGQERVKRRLRTAFESGRIPHAFLFHGPDGTGKDAAAIAFARVLNCERGEWEPCGACGTCRQFDELRHPRLKLIFSLPSKDGEETAIDKLTEAEVREMNEQIVAKAENPYHKIAVAKAAGIKISSIRDIRREASYRSAGGGRTVVVIMEADRMNQSAANALLKTLEEPGGDLLLILTTARRDALLPTIVSRCQQVRFEPLPDHEIAQALEERVDAGRESALLAAQLSGGSFTQALNILTEERIIPREEIRLYLREIVSNNPVKLVQKIREYVGYDQRSLTLFLSGIANWFRDVLAFQSGAVDKLRSADLYESVEKFSRHYTRVQCHDAIDAIEESIALLPRNVNPTLVMTVLSQRLRRCITGE